MSPTKRRHAEVCAASGGAVDDGGAVETSVSVIGNAAKARMESGVSLVPYTSDDDDDEEREAVDVAKEEKTATTASTTAPMVCATCSSTTPKYTCPRCQTRSCSLPCVNAHKRASDCNGKRPRSSFTPISKFTDGQLVADLGFLEEVGRMVNSTQRDPLVQSRGGTTASSSTRSKRQKKGRGAKAQGNGNNANGNDDDDNDGPQMPGAFACSLVAPRFVLLQRQCTHQQIRLLIMPEGLKRHQENTSRVNLKIDTITWHIELLFDTVGVKVALDRVSDHLTWRECLLQLLASDRALKEHGMLASVSRGGNARKGGRATIAQDDEEGEENGAAADDDVQERFTASTPQYQQQPPTSIPSYLSIRSRSSPVLRHQLKAYLDSLDQLRLFIPVPMHSSGATTHFYEPLSLHRDASTTTSTSSSSSSSSSSSTSSDGNNSTASSSSICASLRHKTLIEFPTVHIALPSDDPTGQRYPIAGMNSSSTISITSSTTSSTTNSSCGNATSTS